MVLVAKLGMITFIYSQDQLVYYCWEAPELSRKSSRGCTRSVEARKSFLEIDSPSEKWTSWEHPSQYGRKLGLNVKHILFVGFLPKKISEKNLFQNSGLRSTCEDVALGTVQRLSILIALLNCPTIA